VVEALRHERASILACGWSWIDTASGLANRSHNCQGSLKVVNFKSSPVPNSPVQFSFLGRNLRVGRSPIREFDFSLSTFALPLVDLKLCTCHVIGQTRHIWIAKVAMSALPTSSAYLQHAAFLEYFAFGLYFCAPFNFL
jgi:hypothetical protein